MQINCNNHMCKFYFLFNFLSSPEDIFFTAVRESKSETERERDITHSLALSYASQQGTEPSTWVCVLTWNKNCDFSVSRTTAQICEPHWTCYTQILK